MSEIMFFLSGVSFTAFTLAGIFFLKFWRASGDTFFKCLLSSCWLLAVERLLGLASFAIDPSDTFQSETRPWLYLIRLLAFILIIIAVFKKNYLHKRSP